MPKPIKPKPPESVDLPPSWVQEGRPSPNEQLDPATRAKLAQWHAEKIQQERRTRG